MWADLYLAVTRCTYVANGWQLGNHVTLAFLSFLSLFHTHTLYVVWHHTTTKHLCAHTPANFTHMTYLMKNLISHTGYTHISHYSQQAQAEHAARCDCSMYPLHLLCHPLSSTRLCAGECKSTTYPFTQTPLSLSVLSLPSLLSLVITQCIVITTYYIS